MANSIQSVAAAYGGVVTVAQAQECGFTPEEIRRLCDTGAWQRLRRGIYLPGPEESEPKRRHLLEAAAALLAVDSRAAVLAHTTAALLWDLEWLTEPDLDEVWLAQPPGKARGYRGIKLTAATLPPAHVTIGPRNLPVCTPARVVVDLARQLPLRDALVLADSALRQNLTARSHLDFVLRDCRGWRGARQAGRILALADRRSESVAESLARAVFFELGLPNPVQQVVIKDRQGNVIARVDFLFDGRRTIVEIDGKLKYADDPDALWREKRRADKLSESGYEVVRLSWSDLIGPPELVRERILAAFARAARRLPV